MSRPLADVVASFAGRRVVVLGEAMLDSYLVGRAERIGREAPVPIVALHGRHDEPGGAANAAANVAALGGRATLVSVVGCDDDGDRLLRSLSALGVDTSGIVRTPDRATLAKTRVSAGDHMLVRFDAGTTTPLAPPLETDLLVRLRGALRGADVLIISDYDYGVVGDAVIDALVELRDREQAVVVVDARDLRRYRRLRPDAVKPNYDEALHLLGEPEARDRAARAGQIEPHAERILSLTGARIAAVTFDTDGALVVERGQAPYRTYAKGVSNSRAAGAGDTYAAVLGLALAAGGDTPTVAELSAAAAAVVVDKEGTARCTAPEIVARVKVGAKRVDDVAELAERLAVERAGGRRIVFTNGCFDILHRGHVTYLTRAKALGDVLVVGVNSDGSVARLKGSDRPINPLDDRLAVLEALSCVDHVIPFEEDTPIGLIEILRPDVFTKGGDYAIDRLPEADVVRSFGGRVEILPYLEDRSTTSVIERVQRSSPTIVRVPPAARRRDREQERTAAGTGSRRGR